MLFVGVTQQEQQSGMRK